VAGGVAICFLVFSGVFFSIRELSHRAFFSAARDLS
jgi:hypothetical protein